MKTGSVFEVTFRAIPEGMAPGEQQKQKVAAATQEEAVSILEAANEGSIEVLSATSVLAGVLIADGEPGSAKAVRPESTITDRQFHRNDSVGLADGTSKEASSLAVGDVLIDGFVVKSVAQEGDNFTVELSLPSSSPVHELHAD